MKTSEGPLRDPDPAALTDLSAAELYNLADDIGETTNLAAAHPEKIRELADAWQRWNIELVKPLWAPERGRRDARRPQEMGQ